MTHDKRDIDKFIELFDSVGISYERYITRTNLIVLKHEGGYPGFFTEFEFNPDGSFSDMGAGE